MANERGRPTESLVSRQKIGDAALDIASEKGYTALTMAALARRIGVAPSALYNHISGKDELFYLLQDAVMQLVDVAPLEQALEAGAGYRRALELWAMSYRDVFASHTPLIPLIAAQPIGDSPRTQEMYEVVARAMEAAGCPPEQVMGRIIAMESFIYGSAWDVNAPADLFDPAAIADEHSALGRAAEAIRASAAGGTPTVKKGQRDANPYADQPFRDGLESLLDGMLGPSSSA